MEHEGSLSYVHKSLAVVSILSQTNPVETPILFLYDPP
jgi:hypothetical protein